MNGHFHTTAEKVRFGPFEADLGRRELRKFGLRVKLQGQPFKLLANLLECPGEVVTREDLQRRIWGDEIVVNFDHSLGTAVNKVREALGDSPDNPRYIETLPRCGYRFIAPVQKIEPVVDPAAAPGTDGNTGPISEIVDVANNAPSRIRIEYSKPLLWGAAACTVIGIVALLSFFWNTAPAAPSVRFSEITSSGRVYGGAGNLERFSGVATDGVRVYFSQVRDGHPSLASVSVSGGETQLIPTPAEIAWPVLADVSQDGSKLLVRNLAWPELEGPLWMVRSHGGTASRVLAGPAHDGVWLPDGASILYASGRDLLITRNDGHAPRKLATLPGRAFGMRYSPDGSCLRFTILDRATHASSLWQLSADGKNLQPLLPGWHSPQAECCGRWTAGGKSFIFQSTRDGATNIWALREKRGFGAVAQPVQVTSGPLSFLLPLPARQDNRFFVIGAHTRGQILQFDVRLGRKKPWFADLDPGRIAFSRDGKFMAWSNANDGSLWRSKADGSERLQLTSNPTMRVMRLSWSPDGTRIAFDAKEPGHRRKIYIVSADGGIPEMPIAEERNESDPSWSADGTSIVMGRIPEYLGEDTADKAIYVVGLKTKTLATIPGSKGLFAPRWSPDGRYIAAMPLNQEKILVFERATNKWTETPAPGAATSPTWTSDSKYIYFQSVRQQAMYRVSVPDGRTELVAGMDSVQPADTFNFVGLSPDDSPLLRAQFLTSDIYASTWDPR